MSRSKFVLPTHICLFDSYVISLVSKCLSDMSFKYSMSLKAKEECFCNYIEFSGLGKKTQPLF